MGGVSNKMAGKPIQPPNFVDLSEGEMVDRHELPPGRSLPPHLPPPQDGRCFLLDCHADIFEMVLDRVSTRDLVALMVTSNSAKGVIDQYVEHRLKKDQRLDVLKNFLSTNPLILQEVQARRKLEKLKAQKGDRHVNVVHLKLVRSILDKIGTGSLIRREHVYDADDFPHLGNPAYIVRHGSDELNREVVHLREVCWLHFVKDFKAVPRGRYRASLRVRALPNLRWGWGTDDAENEVTTITVGTIAKGSAGGPGRRGRGEEEGGKECVRPLVSQLVPKSTWMKMAKRTTGPLKYQLDPPARILFDTTSSDSWAWIHLAPFEVAEDEATVRFEFRDFDNPWWKSGMQWDFIQLSSIAS